MRFEEQGVQAKDDNAVNMSRFDVWSSRTFHRKLPNRHWFSTVELVKVAFQLQVRSRKRPETKILFQFSAVDFSVVCAPIIIQLKNNNNFRIIQSISNITFQITNTSCSHVLLLYYEVHTSIFIQ